MLTEERRLAAAVAVALVMACGGLSLLGLNVAMAWGWGDAAQIALGGMTMGFVVPLLLIKWLGDRARR